MKTTHILSLVLALPLAAAAAPPQDGARQPRTLGPVETTQPHAVVTVDCANATWPTLREVAHYNGISVFDPVAHVHHRMVIAGSRACRRGADQVQVVFTRPDREVAVVPSMHAPGGR
jgi:hypothetical protein